MNGDYQRLSPTKEQQAYCAELVMNIEDPYTRTTRDTNDYQKYYGYLGETIIADLFGQARPLGKDDGGCDIHYRGLPIDVKVRSISVVPEPHYTVSVYRSQLDKATPNTHYLFLLYHVLEHVFYVAGLTSKHAIMQAGRLYGVGEYVESHNYVVGSPEAEEYRLPISNLARVSLPPNR